MRDLFPGFYVPTAAQFARLWEECLLVLDSSVLLNLYRFPTSASRELLAVLQTFENRLWIPHQVALEFQRNRLGVRAEQLKKFGEVRDVLGRVESTLTSLASLQLEKRHSSIKTENFTNKVGAALNEFREHLGRLERDQPNVSQEDALRNEIDSLLAGKVGPAPARQEDLDKIFSEGEARYRARRPPGYMDAHKGKLDAPAERLEVQKEASDVPYFCRGLRYLPAFGDLVLWFQLLQHAKDRAENAVLLITDDEKEDWWWSIQSQGKQTLGPRPELVDEIVSTSGVQVFWMYNTARFLTYAKERDPSVKAESIEQVRNVIQTLAPPLFDVVADFSIVSNPAGPWSYGYSKTLGGEFVLHTTRQVDVFPGVDRWSSPQVERCIGVMHNRRGTPVPGPERTYAVPPDMLHMHPGEGGIYDVIRWTCPRSGQYGVEGLFCGLDVSTDIADTDVHVMSLTNPLFGGELYGLGTQRPFTVDIHLDAGDTLDFVVGVGPSGSHGSDSTGLKATITQTR